MRSLSYGIVLGMLLVAIGGGASAQGTPTRPALAIEPAEDPPYDPSGRRDPFRAPTAGTARTGGERTPLQRYEVGQLKLVAIIYDTRDPRAVLEDEEGLGYIVKLGTPVGLNDGRVRAIEQGRVVIEESAVDFYGEAHPTDVVLELRTGERGK